MTVQDGERAVDDVNIETTWQSLATRPRSQLIDVRTRANDTMWAFPISDPSAKELSSSSGRLFRTKLWIRGLFERLTSELKALGAQSDDDLFFICRSGGRSLAAAKAMAEAGYRSCHNVGGGFEGPLDEDSHRGSAGGWKATGLPWLQA